MSSFFCFVLFCFVKDKVKNNWMSSGPSVQFSSVQFSRSVMSDSLRPHELQHARPPCPSPTPGVQLGINSKIAHKKWNKLLKYYCICILLNHLIYIWWFWCCSSVPKLCLTVTPWTVACQALLPSTITQKLLVVWLHYTKINNLNFSRLLSVCANVNFVKIWIKLPAQK